jgi:hypothetical protein
MARANIMICDASMGNVILAKVDPPSWAFPPVARPIVVKPNRTGPTYRMVKFKPMPGP